jgi:hypothetical protein
VTGKKFKIDFNVFEQPGVGVMNSAALSKIQLLTPRVEVKRTFGVLDGEEVDVAVDGARVYVAFKDNWVDKHGVFDPQEDKFISNEFPHGNFGYLIHELDEEEEFIVRGCLSRLTGLLRDKPIPTEDVDFKWSDKMTDNAAKEMQKEEDKRIINDINKIAGL